MPTIRTHGHVSLCTLSAIAVVVLSGCGGAAAPTVSLHVDRKNLVIGQSALLTWTTTGVTSCTAADSWSGSLPAVGSKSVTPPATGQYKFSLTCSGVGGSDAQSVLVTSANPVLSDAGTWTPVSDGSVTSSYDGTLANTFHGIIQLDDSGRYGMAVTGWGFSGWPASLAAPAPVNVGLFSPDSSGNLKLNTASYIADSVTNGSGSMVIADFNGDGRSDLFLAAHNESPFLAMPSTAYLSNGAGGFSKETLSDHVMAHDAQLAYLDGKPTVVTITYQPGEYHPSYTFENGVFVQNTTSLLSGGNSSGAITAAHFGTHGEAELIGSDTISRWDPVTYHGENQNIHVYSLAQYQAEPLQIIVPYLSTLPQYASYSSYLGVGLTHTYRLWNDDLNHDGKPDLLAGESMWSAGSSDYPSALQVLLNKGDGTFLDATARLNPDMSLNTSEMDYAPTFVDLDHSGINTYLFAGSTSWGAPTRQADYVLLNDGTGRLYVGLHSIFSKMASQVFNYLGMQYYSNSTPPRFIGIPQSDGSINFVAEVPASTTVKDTGFARQVFKYVNVPLSYNPAKDFAQDVSVSDRNSSKLMRTWAGNDTFYDTNAASAAHIDGGRGDNKCVYSGQSANYQITHNGDGSYTVSTPGNAQVPALTDTLVRIQTLQFSDKAITLN